MRTWKFFVKMLGVALLLLVVYMLHALLVTSISLRKINFEDEGKKQENTMYCDDTIHIIRYNMSSDLLLEFDRIEVQNGKAYLLALPDTSCFKTIYKIEKQRKKSGMSQIDVEKMLSTFNNYYEKRSVIQLLKCYINYP